jgi:hypothetical protein
MKTRVLLYLVIGFIAALLHAFYVEPKPIESAGHIGLVIATAVGYMLGAFIIASIVLLLLMIFVKKVRKEFWNLSSVSTMGMMCLFLLTTLFG